MCGICGIVDTKIVLTPQTIENMLDIMRHRGPDDEGVVIENNVGLGNVRLKIIDLSDKGHQPMFNDDCSLVIVFNGEIYNYIELREILKKEGFTFRSESDTEVLLKCYEFWGVDCLSKLNGMFAFAIYDKKNNSVFCARDRFGIKPFYYYNDANRFIFSSEIKPILITGIDPEPDYEVIYNFLLFSLIAPLEKTFFKGIKKLLPGHYMEVDLKTAEFKIVKWWELKMDTSSESMENAKSEVIRLFRDSIRLRLRSDVPIGLSLSGGLDSSGIASIMIKLVDKKDDFKAFSSVFSLEFPGNEKKYISEVIKELHINSFETEPDDTTLLNELETLIYFQEEPFYSLSPFAQWEVMKLARQNGIKVIIGGQGSDEMLAGYSGYFGFYFADLIKRGKLLTFLINFLAYKKVHGRMYPYNDIIYPMVPAYFKIRSRKKQSYFLNTNFFNGHWKNSFFSNQVSSRPLKNVLKDSIIYQIPGLLRFEDKASMAFSIESRVPFLDHRLVEYIFKLADNMKLREGKTKYIYREALNGNLPSIIYNRHDKVGFATPDDIWLGKPEVLNYIEQILTSKRTLKRGIITEKGLKKLLINIKEGNNNEVRNILKMLILEIWFRLFIDGDYKKKVSKFKERTTRDIVAKQTPLAVR